MLETDVNTSINWHKYEYKLEQFSSSFKIGTTSQWVFDSMINLLIIKQDCEGMGSESS